MPALRMTGEEARTLLDWISVPHVVAHRDRALITWSEQQERLRLVEDLERTFASVSSDIPEDPRSEFPGLTTASQCVDLTTRHANFMNPADRRDFASPWFFRPD